MNQGRQHLRRSANREPRSSLRIIGGEWRGRRLPILDVPGLRPTSDRIRETLFNWLAPVIDGARCLDLFAGTGALGIEALSRGAASAVFVEQSRAAATTIQDGLTQLGAGHRAQLLVDDGLRGALDGSFDIVFIDPPFNTDLHGPALAMVRPLLNTQARIYLEYPSAESKFVLDLLQHGFETLREKTAGQVGYCIARPVSA